MDGVLTIGTKPNAWWADYEVVFLLTSIIMLFTSALLLLLVYPRVQHISKYPTTTNNGSKLPVYHITFSGDIASNRCDLAFESFRSSMYCYGDNVTLKFSVHLGKFVGLHTGQLKICMDTILQNANITFIFVIKSTDMSQYSLIWIGKFTTRYEYTHYILIHGINGNLVINELTPMFGNGIDIRGYEIVPAWVGKLYFIVDVIKETPH